MAGSTALMLTGCLEFMPGGPLGGRDVDSPPDGFRGEKATTYEAAELQFSEGSTVRLNAFRPAKYIHYSKLLIPFRMENDTQFRLLTARLIDGSGGVSFPENIPFRILTASREILIDDLRTGTTVTLDPHTNYYVSLCYPLSDRKACDNVSPNYYPSSTKTFDLEFSAWKGEGPAPQVEIGCETVQGRRLSLRRQGIFEQDGAAYFGPNRACGAPVASTHRSYMSAFFVSEDPRAENTPLPGYSLWAYNSKPIDPPFDYYGASLRKTASGFELTCTKQKVLSYEESTTEFEETLPVASCENMLIN